MAKKKTNNYYYLNNDLTAKNKNKKPRLNLVFNLILSNNLSTDKICAFFLEWKPDPTFAADSSLSSDMEGVGQFQLVKQHENLQELIADALATTDSPVLKSSPSTNRLIHKNLPHFVKDWEVRSINLIISYIFQSL